MPNRKQKFVSFSLCLLLAILSIRFSYANQEIFFNYPAITSSNGNVISSGNIQQLDLVTGTQSTVVPSLNNPSGLTFDNSGNLYFGNVTQNPMKYSLFKRSSDGSISDIGIVVDTTGGYISTAAWGFDITLDKTSKILYFNSPAITSSNGNVISYGSIQQVDLATGVQSTIVPSLNNPSGLAVDSNGNLYFGNVTINPIKYSLFKRSSDGSISNIGTVVDTTGGYISIGAWGFDIVLDQTSKILYFNSPAITSSNGNVISSGNIQQLDLVTGIKSTVVPSLNNPSGLTFDNSGNLYFGNVTQNPMKYSLFKRSSDGSISNLGTVVDTTGGYISVGAWGFDIALPQLNLKILDTLCVTQIKCDESNLITQQNGLAQDPALLAQANILRDGAVADGVTRLLLNVASDAPVTFTLKPDDGSTPQQQASCLWGTLQTVDGKTSSCSTITVQPQNVPNVGNVVFAVFQAPDGVPQGTTPQVSRNVTVRAAIGSATTSQTLSLQAPPVVLIHGVWSSSVDAWQQPIQGSTGFANRLTGLGLDVYLVDHSKIGIGQSASSFDPYDSNAQIFGLVDLWVGTAKFRVRSKGIHGLAISQVDVLGHSMGGLVARARPVAKNGSPYLRADNGWNGDFHKIITIGSPHQGTKLADTLVADNCNGINVIADASVCLVFGLPTCLAASYLTLQETFSLIGKPLGPAVIGFQTGSVPIQHIGATAVQSSAIIGIAPTGSFTENSLDMLMGLFQANATVASLLGGNGNHDTIVPVTSQIGGIANSATTQITGIVHASLWPGDIGETQSIGVFNQVQALLLQPAGSTAFSHFAALGSGGTYNSLQNCSAQAAMVPSVKPMATTALSFTMLPTPGTVVSPGQVVNLTFNVTGGVPAVQGMFSANGALYPMSGPPPYTLPYTVPTGRAGSINVAAFAFGSQNYAAATSLTVLPTQAPTQLTATPSSLNLALQGSSFPLTVTGSYADGSQIDLTTAEAGTTYATQSGSNNVLSVSTAGIVTANATGQDTVVVANGGLTAKVPVTVNITNHAPVIQIQGGTSLTLVAGSAATLAVTAIDQEGNAMALSLLDTPAFASLTDQGGGKGSLGLNPLPPDVGLHNFYVYALDNGTPPLGVTTAMQVQVQVNTVPINQTISFGSAPTVIVGGTGTVSATGGASGNPVSFTSQTTGVCTISGSTVTGVTAGTCTIAANQAGNANYNAAPQATQSFNIGTSGGTSLTSQTISFGAAPTMVVGGTGAVSATGGASGNPVVFTSQTTGVCTISGSPVTGVTVGTCTIAANQAGNANYYPAPQVMQSFSVSLGSQALAPTDCLFNWAEQNYSGLFAPAGATTAVSGIYTYRHYSATNDYVGVSSVDGHVYYLGPDGVLQDEGTLYDWLPKASCPVPTPTDCLFNWAEQNYPGLFAPSGATTTVSGGYTYRYYSGTNAYLRVSSTDNHVYYLGSDGVMQDEGAMSKWLPLAGCQ